MVDQPGNIGAKDAPGSLDEYTGRLELLYEVAEKASSVSEVSKLLEEILSVTQQILHASASSLFLVDQEKGELYVQAAGGDAAIALKQIRLGVDMGIAGWVATNCTPLLINDVATENRFNQDIDRVTGFSTKSILAVPLVRGKKVIGTLEVLNKDDGGNFTERDLRVLTGLVSTEALILVVSMAATAISNAKLHQQVMEGYRSTVETLVTAADARDPYSWGHSQRVKEYAMIAAKSLSFSPDELQAIEFGALLHDIGKIGINESILRKTGTLTAEDWYVIRKHPLKGANIVGDIPYLESTKEIILHHHERYDGAGYPDGLKGENIPMGARLVAVADAFDTMTIDHSYRAALSMEEAMNELIEGMRSQFCPVAVEAFVSGFKQHMKKIGKTGIRDARRDARKVKETEKPAEKQATIEGDPAAREKCEPEPVAGKSPEKSVSGSEMFQGEVQIIVPSPAGFGLVKRFHEELKRIEGLQIVMVGASVDEGALIVTFLSAPTALVKILNEMAVVESAEKVDKKGKKITVALKATVDARA